jgi:hypothetical protein
VAGRGLRDEPKFFCPDIWNLNDQSAQERRKKCSQRKKKTSTVLTKGQLAFFR